jgi:hypothetical protein
LKDLIPWSVVSKYEKLKKEYENYLLEKS